MKLYICEKPSVAKSVATALNISLKATEGAYISHDIAVTWCYGHLLEQYDMNDYSPVLSTWSLATLPFIPTEWKVKIKEKTKSQFYAIKKLLAASSKVVLATDFDREGEVIGRSILEMCDYGGQVTRIKITAHDDLSMAEALQKEEDGDVTLPLYYAGLGRQRADWLIGLNFTRFYTLHAREKGLNGVWPVGRVQSATLNLVVRRDREIENFTSRPFFENHVTLQASCSFIAKWQPPSTLLSDDNLLLDKAKVIEVAKQLQQGSATAKRVVASVATEYAPLPLNLSTAQIIANERWGYSAQETLDALQKLYEEYKLTSYPRSDCRYLKVEMQSEITDTIAAIRNTDPEIANVLDTLDLTLSSKAWDNEKITAHHGIIPTRQAGNLSALSPKERQIYSLVREHYLVQFLPACRLKNTVIEFEYANHRLIAKGSVILEQGWKTFMSAKQEDADGDEQTLPEIVEGESYAVLKAVTHEGKTKPPRQYTAGLLLAAMNNAAAHVEDDDPEIKKRLKKLSGIGTEATRAGIIESLYARELIENKGKKIISTIKGQTLIDIISDDLKSVALTAIWEQQLDDISARKAKLPDFLAEISATVKNIFASQATPEISTAGLVFHCPKCGGELRHLIKAGKGGYNFWSCKNRETCNSTFDNKGNKPDFTAKSAKKK